MEIYEKTLEVLGPEVEKAKKMMLFVNEAAARFTEEIKTLAHPEKRKDFISETYLLTIAKLINMFSTLDALKNMKACINNDMACYKRLVDTLINNMELHIDASHTHTTCAQTRMHMHTSIYYHVTLTCYPFVTCEQNEQYCET